MQQRRLRKHLISPRLRAATAGAAMALTASQAAAQEPMFINVGTSSSASSQYTYWVSVGQAIEAGTGGAILPTIMETGASVDNIRRMKRSEIELGLATAEAAGQAYRGIGAFADDEPWQELRILWCYAALPNIFVVREDAEVEAFGDLAGEPYNAGIPGSSTEAQTRAVFEALGIAPELEASATADAVDSLRDGRIVGFTKAAASATEVDASFMELDTTVDVEVVELSADQVATVLEAHPYYSAIEVPAGTYPGQDAPVTTLAAAACGAATPTSLSEKQAYEVVKAVFEQKQLQADAYPAVADVDFGQLTTELATIPLHPGAVRYFHEIGVEIPPELMP